MACSCGCNPCSCSPAPVTCCTPTTESVEYTFENANAVGIGVFDNDTDNLVQFRGIVSESAALTVTLNATDNTLVFDFDDSLLVADIPDATTTQRGILETSTNAEALAKAATDKILTPSNLAALGSTTTFAGLVELATNAETIAGVSATLAVTPAGLAAVGATNTLTTWVNSVTRAGDTPTFDGRIGVQLDTNIPWVANGTGVGDFDVPVLVGAGTNTLSAATDINMGGSSFSLSNGSFGTNSTVVSTITEGTWTFEQCAVGFTSSCTLDIETTTVISIDGVTIPANSVLSISGAGTPASRLLNTFISTANTQTGWGTPSGTLARTTFASYAGQTISNPPTQAEVQALDDAVVIVSRRLAALVTDLLAIKLPAA